MIIKFTNKEGKIMEWGSRFDPKFHYTSGVEDYIIDDVYRMEIKGTMKEMSEIWDRLEGGGDMDEKHIDAIDINGVNIIKAKEDITLDFILSISGEPILHSKDNVDINDDVIYLLIEIEDFFNENMVGGTDV